MAMQPSSSLLLRLRRELETPREDRPFGSGWLSGTLALVLGLSALLLIVALHFPALLTTPELGLIGASAWTRPALHLALIIAYALALLSLILRDRKILGFVATAVTLSAILIGLPATPSPAPASSGLFFGLDFFVLNLLFLGFIFVPLERYEPNRPEQVVLRAEWREDLLYYLVSSLLVQVVTYLTLAPSRLVLAVAQFDALRAAIGAQPFVLQVVEIMFLTDFVQYWVHRAFHRVPFLWRFHAVHHSARAMDWIAGSRMHLLEVVVLRASTATPMFTLGFDASALQTYILIVYVYSSFIHANLGWSLERIGGWVVTPRFHHWHHGLEPEAVDVNFAVHFPLFDRLFGTYHLPPGRWPQGYGVPEPVPHGYARQFLYPFRR